MGGHLSTDPQQFPDHHPDMFPSQPAVPLDVSPRHTEKQSVTNDPVIAMMASYPTKIQHKRRDRMIQPTPHSPFAYDPTPGSKLVISPTPKLYNPPVQVRGKRDSDTHDRSDYRAEELKNAVKTVLQTMIENNQHLREVKDTIKQDKSIDPLNYHLNHLLHHPEHDHLLHHPEHDHLPPPVITTKELPAPPGCRSLATKQCVKIPVSVPRQVPYSVCRTVPDVDCVHVLKTVPELQCTPEVFRDCADYEQIVPYLEEDEECEEIIFDQCLEIEEKIPVEVCKTTRKNENAVTINRGTALRKEGEKRRKPITKSKAKEKLASGAASQVKS